MSGFNVLVFEGSPHRVFFVGEIDIMTAPRVTEVLCDLWGDIEVDCSEVTFIDTAGFGVFDWSYVVATARGNSFVVTGLRRFQTHISELLRVPYVRSRASIRSAKTDAA